MFFKIPFFFCLSFSQLSPLQSLIINGDAAALMALVRQSFGGLMEPDNEGWIALHEASFYGQLQCLAILIKGEELVSDHSMKKIRLFI